MKTNFVFAAVLAACLTTSVASAQTPGETLQHAIFAQDAQGKGRVRRMKESELAQYLATRLRLQQGVATGLDVFQSEQLLRSATAQIAASERTIAQAENALSLLTGQAPSAVARGRKLEELAAPAQVPVGLPSALLERRPDILAAERSLIAANAQIGVARAAYFPQISLTGFMGGQSRGLTDLFTEPARQWSFVPCRRPPGLQCRAHS